MHILSSLKRIVAIHIDISCKPIRLRSDGGQTMFSIPHQFSVKVRHVFNYRLNILHSDYVYAMCTFLFNEEDAVGTTIVIIDFLCPKLILAYAARFRHDSVLFVSASCCGNQKYVFVQRNHA